MFVLILKDSHFFSKALKIFSSKPQITAELAESALNIHSLSPPYFYLSFPAELFQLYELDNSQPKPYEFSLNAKDLLTALDRISTSYIYITHNSLTLFKLSTDLSDEIINKESINNLINYYISVPLKMPIISHYKYITEFTTKLLMNKEIVNYLVRGNVLYSNSKPEINKKGSVGYDDIDQSQTSILRVTRSEVECIERMEIDVEYLREGYLEFYCNNSWVGELVCIDELSKSIMIGFSDEMMVIKCMFEKYKNVYLEIQVNEKIRN